MAGVGSTLQILRRKRVTPRQDAEQHIHLNIDKAGLKERFINLYKGRGVFATEAFRKGDFLLEYRGKLLQQGSSLHLKHYSDTEAVFLFDFQWQGKSYCLDASIEDTSLGRLVNDDDTKPNCKMKILDIGGKPHLSLFTLRDISPGEEVTYNYGDAAWPWRKQEETSAKVRGQSVEESNEHQEETSAKVRGQSVEESNEHQEETSAKVRGQSVEESNEHQEETSAKVRGQSVEESNEHQEETSAKVRGQSVEESNEHQEETSAKVRGQSVEESNEHQEETSAKVRGQSVEESNEHQEETSAKVRGQSVEESNEHQEETSAKVRGQSVEESNEHQFPIAKLKKHHEECFNQQKIAEEQQHAKDRQHTINLLKRARLAQEMAELDALLNSQSPLEDAIQEKQNDIPPLSTSDASPVDELTMACDPVDCGELAATIRKTLVTCSSSACQDSEDISAEQSKRKAFRQRKVTIDEEDTFDESDQSNYDDLDYVPDSDESSSDPDIDTELAVAEKPLLSLRYPPLTTTQANYSKTAVTKYSRESQKKHNSNTPRKRESSSPCSEKSSSSTPKKSRVQLLSESVKVLPSSKSKSHRVYDKRNYCLYCLKPSSKIARHLETVHKNVEEVTRAFLYSKNSKERRNALNLLRRRGNFAYNALVVSKGAGELQACYRPRKESSGSDFIHCFNCQGLYAKRTLWKHIKICPAQKPDDDESGTSKQRVRSKCALKTAVVHEISEGLKSVISSMTYDEVTRTIQNDQLLLQFGQHLFDLNGSRKNRHDLIRQRLRELGRLLVVAQKKTPIHKAEELIYPSNFSSVISAVKELAGHNPESNTFHKPSLALKVGHSLGVLCELVESDNLSTVDRNDTLVEYAREFRTIKSFRWKALVTRGATTTMKELKWNAPQILPFTEDVKCLDTHMENVKEAAEIMLKSSPSAKNYATLSKVTLAQVIIFNRKREGEVSRMELATFRARKKSELNKDLEGCLTTLEKKMCEFFIRVEIRGKRGRGVPVLLKPTMVSAMELLAQTREMCGVLRENIYMFARPGALSSYRGGECIQKFARESGAKNPEVLTSTRLRKHIATMSQVLNLQENEADQLADFLGHDIRVHRQYYRLPQGTLQLAKMSKVLLAVEQGTLSQYKGQALDDLEIYPEEKVDCSQEPDQSSDEDEPGIVTASPATETTGEDDHEAETPSLPSTPSDVTLNQDISQTLLNRVEAKRKWDDSEVRAVERHLMHFIHTCKVPQKIDCLRCINAEPRALRDRNWTGVKNYVRNRITALKRNACAKQLV